MLSSEQPKEGSSERTEKIASLNAPLVRSTLQFDGNLDIATRSKVERALRQVEADITIIDLSSVRFLDAGTLGLFVAFKKRQIESGRLGIVRVVTLNPLLRRLFILTGLTEMFELHESLSSAENQTHGNRTS